MVGSCSTLVAERALSLAADKVSEPVAATLLGTILLDTVNLDEEAGRATEKDREVADLLGEICGQEKGEVSFIVFLLSSCMDFYLGFWVAPKS